MLSGPVFFQLAGMLHFFVDLFKNRNVGKALNSVPGA